MFEFQKCHDHKVASSSVRLDERIHPIMAGLTNAAVLIEGTIDLKIKPLVDLRPNSPKLPQAYLIDGLIFESTTNNDEYDIVIKSNDGKFSFHYNSTNRPTSPTECYSYFPDRSCLDIVYSQPDHTYQISFRFSNDANVKHIDRNPQTISFSSLAEEFIDRTKVNRSIEIALNVVWRLSPASGQKEYLLVQEARDKTDRYKWYFPAGRIENGESIVEGAMREAKEEAGISLKFLGMINEQIVYRANGLAKKRYFFSANPLDALEVPKSKPDRHSECAKWFSAEEISGLSATLRDEEVLDYIRRVEENHSLYAMPMW